MNFSDRFYRFISFITACLTWSFFVVIGSLRNTFEHAFKFDLVGRLSHSVVHARTKARAFVERCLNHPNFTGGKFETMLG